MFWLLRRVFWFGTGASVGFGGAMWIRNRVRRAVARYAPGELATGAATSARRAGRRVQRLGEDVREAVEEGRSAKRRREEELREELHV